MSRKSVAVNSNTTRLPPKTNAATNQSWISAKAKKGLMEKENKLREDLGLILKEKTEILVKILKAGGVPKYPW